jgi:glycosyltransferase involved in cell wall biosynthesis
MILFIHETKHIGGGQSFVNAYKRILHDHNVAFDFFEDSIRGRKLIGDIFKKKYHKAFLHIYSPKYLPLVLLLRIVGIPIVLTVYGVWFLELQSQYPTQLHKKTYWLKLAQGIIFLCSHTLIVLSVYEKKLIEHHFRYTKNKTVVIPGGVDRTYFHPVSRAVKTTIRKNLHLPQKSPILLICSRLERRKGIDLAIGAFNEVVKIHPKSFLCIVFPTAYYNQFALVSEFFHQIRALGIGENIHFVSGVNQKNIPLYFQASDVFAMSSRNLETFGLTTLEAAASGCIPVGFHMGATPEILGQIDQNLIAFPVHSKTLAQKLNWVLSLSPEEREQVLRKCRQIATRYSWESISQTLCGNLT